MDEDIIAARKEMTELGLVEDSGRRRPDNNGVMQVVWVLSARGLLYVEYLELGYTREQAQALALLPAS